MSEPVYLENLDELEDQCIALRQKRAILFLYPFREKVARTGAKVMTRDGRVVKKVRPASKDGVTYITGYLDEECLTWDMAGRKRGPYEDDDLDLFIPERYFLRSWKDNIGMSNSEWAIHFQRKHPTVSIPDPWDDIK